MLGKDYSPLIYTINMGSGNLLSDFGFMVTVVG